VGESPIVGARGADVVWVAEDETFRLGHVSGALVQRTDGRIVATWLPDAMVLIYHDPLQEPVKVAIEVELNVKAVPRRARKAELLMKEPNLSGILYLAASRVAPGIRRALEVAEPGSFGLSKRWVVTGMPDSADCVDPAIEEVLHWTRDPRAPQGTGG
jgi:hypothetical protein